MKHIKLYEEFVNINEGRINGVKFYINSSHPIVSAANSTDKKAAQTIINHLNLKTGEIDYFEKRIEITGITHSGDKIHVSQRGNFNANYDQKLSKPTITLNGKDIYSEARKAIDGWWGLKKSEEIDASRVDLWGHIIKSNKRKKPKSKKMTSEELMNAIKSTSPSYKLKWDHWGDFFSAETGERGPRTDHGGGPDGDGWMSPSQIEKYRQPYVKKWKPKMEKMIKDLAKSGIKADWDLEYGEKGHIMLQVRIKSSSSVFPDSA